MVAEAYHVWDFVEEELAERGWSLDELAARMGGDFAVSRLTLDLLQVARDDAMTDVTMEGETSAMLGRAFGVSPRLFVNLHNYWRDWKLFRGGRSDD